ncbi:MAG: TonB-dependent receptor [Bacteroidetes bacterium]|nr:TonB-dependent receptor [Bacteroidota bacterium]
MKKITLATLIFVLISTLAFSQKLTQTIRGTVKDNDSKQPLIGATVVIKDKDFFTGATTDLDGVFRLENVPIGRTSVQFSYMGYEAFTIPNIEVNSGKEVVLDVSMQESAVKLNEVVVTSDLRKGEAQNDMAQLSSHSITLEETKRFTGGMDDPARVVASFAGVASTPDGSSDIIVRGNSPKYLQWRLDGAEISSPYHMDDQNSSFGALTALNNNLLATSDFYTGAYSSEYGDVISGVYDVKLRNGNNEKFEATTGLGMMGTELTVEGPFKKGYSGSYLFNYRYSTITLIKKLGIVDVPGGVNYQDATFKVILPTRKAGVFSFYGLGGLSGVTMENMGPSGLSTPGLATSSALISKDYYKSNYLANLGMNHVFMLNSKSYLKTSVNYSATGADDDIYERDSLLTYTNEVEYISDSISERMHMVKSRIVNSAIRGSITYSNKINSKNKIQIGAKYTLSSFNNYQDMYSRDAGVIINLNDFKTDLGALNNFISWKHSFNDQLNMVTGLHNMNVLSNHKSTLEPRFSISWNLDESNSLHAGYGMHSTMEKIHNYYTRILQDDGSYTELNRNLGLLKAHHFVLGYEKRFSKNLVAKIEGYYHYLYDLPVENNPASYYCTINEGIDYNYVELVNKGVGKNYGVEISVERYFDKGYYFLVNGSLFDSKYKSLEGVWRNTRYNNNYIVNILGGKEFKNIGRKHNQTLAVNTKIFFEGGERYIPLLRDAQGNVAVDTEHGNYFDYSNAYNNQLDNLFYMNLSASYKFNRPKATHEIFLDLMNLTNSRGKMAEYFDASKPGKVGYITQFSFFPNLMYRIYF